MESGNLKRRDEVRKPLTTVARLTMSDQAALKANGIDSCDAYWIFLAKNKKLTVNKTLTQETITRIESVMLDAAEAQTEPFLNRVRSMTMPRFRNHIPDIFAGIVLILALWRIFPGCY
jgi:hypothetical protein